MGSMSSLLWGLLFGSIGMGYFVYGKKQGRGIPLLSGIALMAFPYFITNSLLIVLIGLVRPGRKEGDNQKDLSPDAESSTAF